MIWLRHFVEDKGALLFKSSQSTYRFMIRRKDDKQHSLGLNFGLSEMKSIKVVLAPKELSYWDVD